MRSCHSLLLCTAFLACDSAQDDAGGGSAVDAGIVDAQVPAAIVNPSGDCLAPDLGSRIDVPITREDGLTWLADCNNPLRREYYRVFVSQAGQAVILPRPEWGGSSFSDACSERHELWPVLERNRLCPDLTMPPRVPAERLLPEEALAIAHHLHTTLRFVENVGVTRTGQRGGMIRPEPLVDDMLAACGLRPEASSEALKALCDRMRADPSSFVNREIPPLFADDVAAELAPLLNELYGAR